MWRKLLDSIFADREMMLGVIGGIVGGLYLLWQYMSQMDKDEWAIWQGRLVWIGVVLILAAIAFAWWAYARNAKQARERDAINERVAKGPTVLLLPRANAAPVKIEGVRLWDRLIGVLPPGEHMAWEVSGNGDGQQFSLHASDTTFPAVLSQVITEWPDMEQRDAGHRQFHDPVTSDGSHCVWLELAPAAGVATAIMGAADDPLRAILTELARWPDDCMGVVQFLVRPDTTTAVTLRAQSQQMRATTADMDAGGRAVANKQARGMDARAERAFYEGIIRVAAHASNPQAAQARARALFDSARAAFDISNPLTIINQGQGESAIVARSWVGKGRPWGAGEIAAIAHLPGMDITEHFPRLETASAQYRPADPKVRCQPGDEVVPYVSELYPLPEELKRGKAAKGAKPRKRILYGVSVDKTGREAFCGIGPRDFTTHAFTNGSTGSGKSTLLKNLAVQAYGQGMTVLMLDPHGKLADDTALAFPDNRMGDILMLDMSAKCPPALPLFSSGLRYGLDDAVQAAMDVFKTIDSTSWDNSQQMQMVLSSAVRILLSAERYEANVPKLVRMFTRGVYRDEILRKAARIRDAQKSAEFWRDTVVPALDPDSKKASSIQQSITSAMRRFNMLIDHKYLRRSLALHPLGPQLDMETLLDSRKAILVPVRKTGRQGLGDKAWGVVLTLYVWSAYMATMGRDWRDPQLAMMVLDELASMKDLELVEYIHKLLAEARKFGLSVVIGTQSLHLLGADTRDNIRTNTNQKFILKCANEDEAKAAIKVLNDDSLQAGSLVRMPRYSGYVGNMVDGETLRPALIKMLDEIALAEMPGSSDVPRPEPFKPSKEFDHCIEIAPTLARSDPKNPDDGRTNPVLDYLVSNRISDATFARIVDDFQQSGIYLGRWMLANPGSLRNALATDSPDTAYIRRLADRMLESPAQVMDKGSRAAMISGALYGLPWWLREAAFLRSMSADELEDLDAATQDPMSNENNRFDADLEV